MLSKLKAKDAMLRNITVISPEDSLAVARLIMERHGIGGLPVVEEDKLVGMITHRDIILIGEIGELKVKDVMMRDIITVEEETPLVDVMRIMKEHGYQRVPVVKGEKIVGLVTQSSVIEAIMRER